MITVVVHWIPLISSLVVAGAAFVGVLINNRTNRRAISAADERNQIALDAAQRNVDATISAAARNIEATNAASERREHDKWRREQIVAIVANALDIANTTCQRLWRKSEWNNDALLSLPSELHHIVEQSRAEANALKIIADDTLYRSWENLWAVLVNSLLAAYDFRKRHRDENYEEIVRLAIKEQVVCLMRVHEAESHLISAAKAVLPLCLYMYHPLNSIPPSLEQPPSPARSNGASVAPGRASAPSAPMLIVQSAGCRSRS
ncbi:hypothetical protein [Nocardia sp. NPDC057455]|uniref:hypothetical protein n=1 Tax=Nocardia sp. NPDC057455 TaxID=3346138 RepID=UPI00366EB328